MNILEYFSCSYTSYITCPEKTKACCIVQLHANESDIVYGDDIALVDILEY